MFLVTCHLHLLDIYQQYQWLINQMDYKYQKFKTSYQNNLKELAEHKSINFELRNENQKLS